VWRDTARRNGKLSRCTRIQTAIALRRFSIAVLALVLERLLATVGSLEDRELCNQLRPPRPIPPLE
jgi:hypothetical protein